MLIWLTESGKHIQKCLGSERRDSHPFLFYHARDLAKKRVHCKTRFVCDANAGVCAIEIPSPLCPFPMGRNQTIQLWIQRKTYRRSKFRVEGWGESSVSIRLDGPVWRTVFVLHHPRGYNPWTGRQRQDDPWDLVASQCGQIESCTFSEGHWLKRQVGSNCRGHLMLTSGLHTQAHRYTLWAGVQLTTTLGHSMSGKRMVDLGKIKAAAMGGKEVSKR